MAKKKKDEEKDGYSEKSYKRDPLPGDIDAPEPIDDNLSGLIIENIKYIFGGFAEPHKFGSKMSFALIGLTGATALLTSSAMHGIPIALPAAALFGALTLTIAKKVPTQRKWPRVAKYASALAAGPALYGLDYYLKEVANQDSPVPLLTFLFAPFVVNEFAKYRYNKRLQKQATKISPATPDEAMG